MEDHNILEQVPDEEVLLDEVMEVQIDIKLLNEESLDLFEERCHEKLVICKERGFNITVESLNSILNDIKLEKERRASL